jgi:lipopolysaccharide biosynthesis protein
MVTPINSATCSVFFHNYYGDHENWVQCLSEKITLPFTLFYNIVEDSLYNLEDDHRLMDRMQQAASGSQLKKIILRRSSNQGKDIGGKLVLLDACLRNGINDEYQVFLHDKKSPYKVQGREWADKLFRIIEPSFIEKTLIFFREHPDTGIISTIDSIMDEYDFRTRSFASNNRIQLTQLRSGFNIANEDHRYVAGTMFWARSLPILDFFRQHHPLEIRKTLEKGNIMDENDGSYTHAWERMLSWLIFARGYTIKGL